MARLARSLKQLRREVEWAGGELRVISEPDGFGVNRKVTIAGFVGHRLVALLQKDPRVEQVHLAPDGSEVILEVRSASIADSRLDWGLIDPSRTIVRVGTGQHVTVKGETLYGLDADVEDGGSLVVEDCYITPPEFTAETIDEREYSDLFDIDADPHDRIDLSDEIYYEEDSR